MESIEYDKAKIYKELNRIREKVMRSSEKFIDDDGYVCDFQSIEDCIRIEISKSYELNEYVNQMESGGKDLWDPSCATISDADRFFVVFDRDKEVNDANTRSDAEYKKVIDICEKKGYDVLLSTPMFEFWLLLHHHDVLPGSYPVDLSQKETILEELADWENKCKDWSCGSLDKVKNISSTRFDLYYNNDAFKTAVERSKKLETRPYHLLNSIGSSVGVELESLMR